MHVARRAGKPLMSSLEPRRTSSTPRLISNQARRVRRLPPESNPLGVLLAHRLPVRRSLRLSLRVGGRGGTAPPRGRRARHADRLAPAQAQLLRHLRTGGAVVRRDHRIVVRQAPLVSILLRSQTANREVAAQGLVRPAVLEADQEVWRDRLADLSRRGLSVRRRLALWSGRLDRRPSTDGAQALRYLSDHRADFGHPNVRVREVRGRDFGNPIAQAIVFLFCHGFLHLVADVVLRARYVIRYAAADNPLTHQFRSPETGVASLLDWLRARAAPPTASATYARPPSKFAPTNPWHLA